MLFKEENLRNSDAVDDEVCAARKNYEMMLLKKHIVEDANSLEGLETSKSDKPILALLNTFVLLDNDEFDISHDEFVGICVGLLVAEAIREAAAAGGGEDD